MSILFKLKLKLKQMWNLGGDTGQHWQNLLLFENQFVNRKIFSLLNQFQRAAHTCMISNCSICTAPIRVAFQNRNFLYCSLSRQDATFAVPLALWQDVKFIRIESCEFQNQNDRASLCCAPTSFGAYYVGIHVRGAQKKFR